MFNDLGDADADNSHWVTFSTSRSDKQDAQQRESSGSSSSHNIASGSFDPAVGSPRAHSAVTSSADLLGASPVSVSHIAAADLSAEDILHCKVCDVALTGVEPARQHYAGKPHKRAQQKIQIQEGAKKGKDVSLYCKVCQKPFTSEISANDHYISSKHLKAVKEESSRLVNQVSSTSSDDESLSASFRRMMPKHPGGKLSNAPADDLSADDILHCKVCNVPLTGVEPARQHYAGKQHKKALQKTQIQEGAYKKGKGVSLYCKVCRKPFTSEISANDHYISSKHLKAVKEELSRLVNQVSSSSSDDEWF